MADFAQTRCTSENTRFCDCALACIGVAMVTQDRSGEAMTHRVCPWWLGYWLISPLRRRGQNPREILSPHVHEGVTVLEPGSGMGFFTLDLLASLGPPAA
jgi:hypothetical protein